MNTNPLMVTKFKSENKFANLQKAFLLFKPFWMLLAVKLAKSAKKI
jgi:hypothetical protein